MSQYPQGGYPTNQSSFPAPPFYVPPNTGAIPQQNPPSYPQNYPQLPTQGIQQPYPYGMLPTGQPGPVPYPGQYPPQAGPQHQTQPIYPGVQSGQSMNQSTPTQPCYTGCPQSYPQQQGYIGNQPFPNPNQSYIPQYQQGMQQPGYQQQATQSYTPSVSTNPSQMGNKQKHVYVGPCMPSLKPALNTSPVTDASTLHKAFKGIGCDRNTIIAICTHRCCSDREKIKTEYQKQFKKSLVERAISELYDPLERVIVMTLYTGADQDAYILRLATKGLGTNESALRYVLCTHSSAQMTKIKDSYQKMHNQTLEKHITSDTSGNFQKILLTLLNQPRDQSIVVNESMAQNQASELHSRSLIRINAPESMIQVFCLSNYEQLKATFKAFVTAYGKTMYNYLKSFSEGEYEKTLMEIYSFVENPIHYQSKRLREGIIKSDIFNIILVVATRCEIDFGTVLQDYQKVYNKDFGQELKTVFDAQHKETVRALLSLMGQF